MWKVKKKCVIVLKNYHDYMVILVKMMLMKVKNKEGKVKLNKMIKKKVLSLCLAFGLAVTSVPALQMSLTVQAAEESDRSITAREAVTLESVREEAAASYAGDKKGFDITLSDQTFAGSTNLDYSTDTTDRKYMEVLNNLRQGNDDQTVIIRFKTSGDGLLFGAGVDTNADAGKNMTFAVEDGKFRMVIRNTKKATSAAAAGLKGSFSSGLSNGSWHTVAVSFAPSTGYVNDNIRLVIDGGEDLYATTGWGSNWGKGGFNQSQDDAYSVFQIGGGGYVTAGRKSNYASAAFNGQIDFITVINKAYTVSELQEITKEEGTVVENTDDFSVMTAAGSRNTWLFTGGTETVADFSTSGTTRNYVGLFEDNLRAGGSYIERSRFVFNTARRGADIASVLAAYDTMIAPYGTKAVGIMVGASDYTKGTAGIAAFKTALRQLLDKIYENDKLPFLLTPYPSKDSTANAQITAYKDAIREVAGTRTRVVDLTSLAAAQVQADGSLTPAGHQSVANAIKSTLGVGSATSFGFTMKDGSYTVAKKNADGTEATTAAVTADGEHIYVSVDAQTIAGSSAKLAYELTDASGQVMSGEVPAGNLSFTIGGVQPATVYTLQVYDTSRKADGSIKESYRPVEITTVSGAVGQVQEYEDGNISSNRTIQSLLTREEPVTYLFMGDSITHGIVTQGYDNVPQMFAKYLDELGRTEDVVLNTGVSNATIATTLAQKDHRLEKFDPDVVMIMLGTNDTSYNGENTVADNGTASKTGITVQQFKDRYKELVRAVHRNNANTSIVLRVPCEMIVDGPHSGYEEKFNSIHEVAEEMRQEISGLNITVVDHMKNWRDYSSNVRNDNIAKGTTYGWMVDNVHPNGRGNLAMFQQIIRELGLYVNVSDLANYQYALDGWTGTSDITVPVTQRAVSASFAMNALAGYSNSLKEVTLTFTDTKGKSISKTEKYAASGTVTVSGLDTTENYTVKVTGKDASNSRQISFPTTLEQENPVASAEEKAALQSEITKAQEADESLYTDESWQEYLNAISAAEEVLNKQGVTVTEVASAKAQLILAAASLKVADQEYKDRKEIQEELARVLGTAEATYTAGQKNYTKESWDAFESAYQNAKAADPNAEISVLRTILFTLIQSERGLTVKDSKTQSPAEVPVAPVVPVEPGKVFDSGNYSYKVLSVTDLTAEVTALKNPSLTSIKIYNTVTLGGKSFKITSVAPSVFKNNKKIKSVVIGKNVTKIGKDAFSGCTGLKKLTLGVNVKTIDKNSFSNCKKLSSIVVKGKAIKTIKSGAFKKTAVKMTVKMPKKLDKKQRTVLMKKFTKAGVTKKAKMK